ncbi:MAG TPA: hypothetical protein VLE20_08690 [Blastocatellia bacterium]|nr:hypothetical protein [Blastocatellia bacterium]
MSFYAEAMRIVIRNRIFDPVSFCVARRMTAVIRSMEGDHQGALSDLEQMLPLARVVRSVQPYAYYDYLNTLAVEMCAVGRLEEAKNVSEIALASPFAPAYPEWRETHQEIELTGLGASRSTVGVSKTRTETDRAIASNAPSDADVIGAIDAGATEDSNVLRFTLREQSVGGVLARSSKGTSEPARVLVMSDRNKTVGRDSNEITKGKNSYRDLDGRQLLLKIMELTAAKDVTDYELLEILESIENILYRQKDPGKP